MAGFVATESRNTTHGCLVLEVLFSISNEGKCWEAPEEDLTDVELLLKVALLRNLEVHDRMHLLRARDLRGLLERARETTLSEVATGVVDTLKA